MGTQHTTETIPQITGGRWACPADSVAKTVALHTKTIPNLNQNSTCQRQINMAIKNTGIFVILCGERFSRNKTEMTQNIRVKNWSDFIKIKFPYLLKDTTDKPAKQVGDWGRLFATVKINKGLACTRNSSKNQQKDSEPLKKLKRTNYIIRFFTKG